MVCPEPGTEWGVGILRCLSNGAKGQPTPAAEFRALSWNSADGLEHKHCPLTQWLVDRQGCESSQLGLDREEERVSEKQLLLVPSACPMQLEQSEAKCEDALKTQKVLTADLESMHSELENVTRSKSLVLSLPRPQKYMHGVLH